jgi:hypothetical protein
MGANSTDNRTLERGPGRPTTYDPDLGEKIVAIMEQGLSLAAAAAECNVHRRRVYDWEAAHPDFAEMVALGRVKRQAFLERRLLAADAGPVVTSSIFALKNAAGEDWREKTEIDHRSGDGSMTPREPRYQLVDKASDAGDN